MGLDTNTDVEKIQTVQDDNGSAVPPANATEQQATNDRLGNRDTLDSLSHTTGGTNAEALPSKTVPEGVTPLVVADTGNADTVFVGTADHQPVPLASAKDSFASNVRDTSEIYVRTPSAGDTVFVLWERDN
jgi:hypothetical protein